MTQSIRQQYVEARQDQATRNEARRIRSLVHKARTSSHDAGIRWPFELLQNALDGGARAGRELVNVTLSSCDGTVVFEHDGAPFSLQDLAALLSGGSSKEFESTDKTGRFGTGFLVTHVLAESTRLRGLIAGDGHYELFQLSLNRSGDEHAILANIRQSEKDLDEAVVLTDIDGEPSARFEYSVDSSSALSYGLQAFKESLPYLYATRPRLGRTRICLERGTFEEWTPSSPFTIQDELVGPVATGRTLRVTNFQGQEIAKHKAFRFQKLAHSNAACIAFLTFIDDDWQFMAPSQNLPRIFRDYPIRSATFFPVSFVIDGAFDVAPERDIIAMSDEDKTLVRASLEAAPTAIATGATEQWRERHRLCQLAPVQNSFTRTQEETDWWNREFKIVAEQFAQMPVVETRAGYGPASENDGEWFADFPVPRLDEASQIDETTLDRFWPLVDEAEDL